MGDLGRLPTVRTSCRGRTKGDPYQNMIIPLFALLAQTGQVPERPLAHLQSMVRGAKTLSAEITLSSPKVKDTGFAKLVFSRPNRVYYRLKWDELDYTFVGTEKGRWDADARTKTYD